MTLKTVLVEWWNGQKLPHILKDGMADNLPQILECMAWFWTMAGHHRKLFNRLVSNSLCKIVWKLIISTKLRLRGMHTYFESKIGMTGSPILSFVPSLHRKITLKKERDGVPSFAALIRSPCPSRTCMYAQNTLRLNKSWRRFLELKGYHMAWFQQYLISIQSVEVHINTKKGQISR